jgi:hypothetical protein
MNTLRVAEQNEERDRPRVERARRTAVEVAADAAVQRRSRALTAAQLDALEEAAQYIGMSPRQLDQATLGNGNCHDQDAEQWYPLFSEDLTSKVKLDDERARAAELCGGCPVRGQCLARDYIQSRGRRGYHLWGITGGLGARDRRALLPLWVDLVARLDGLGAVPVAVAS